MIELIDESLGKLNYINDLLNGDDTTEIDIEVLKTNIMEVIESLGTAKLSYHSEIENLKKECEKDITEEVSMDNTQILGDMSLPTPENVKQNDANSILLLDRFENMIRLLGRHEELILRVLDTSTSTIRNTHIIDNNIRQFITLADQYKEIQESNLRAIKNIDSTSSKVASVVSEMNSSIKTVNNEMIEIKDNTEDVIRDTKKDIKDIDHKVNMNKESIEKIDESIKHIQDDVSLLNRFMTKLKNIFK